MARYTKKIFIWIPREDKIYRSIWANHVDVSRYVQSAKFTKCANQEVGSFSVTLSNPKGEFSESYVGNEEVELTMGTSPGSTDLKFRGYITKVWPKILNGQNVMVLTGQQMGGRLMDFIVSESYSAVAASEVITELMGTYAEDFTVVNVATCTIPVTVNWVDKPLWDCIQEILGLVGYDAYVDDDSDLHFFESGSVENLDEAIVISNYKTMEYFGGNIAEVKNKLSFIGQTDEGLPIISTAEDADSISTYGQRESVIKNTRANTSTEVDAKATALTAENKDPTIRGKFITNQMLLTLKPADSIWVSLPPQQIHDEYIVYKYSHVFPECRTEVQFQQEQTIVTILKARVNTEHRIENISSTAGYHYSWAFPFDDDETDIFELSDSQVTAGALTLATGKTSGSMTTTTKSTSSSPGVITSCRLKVSGVNLDNCTYTVSLDGVNDDAVVPEEDYVAGSVTTASDFIHSGASISIDVSLEQVGGLDPTIESMVLLFDT